MACVPFRNPAFAERGLRRRRRRPLRQDMRATVAELIEAGGQSVSDIRGHFARRGPLQRFGRPARDRIRSLASC